MVWTLLFADGYPVVDRRRTRRASGDAARGPASCSPGSWCPTARACKDGFVVMTLVLGQVGAKSFGR